MSSRPDPDEERIAAWLRSAPQRPEPSGLARARARAAAKARWREQLQSRARASRRSWPAWAGLAAALTLAVAGWLQWPRTLDGPGPGVAFATIERMTGDAHAAVNGGPDRALAQGATLVTGMVVATGAGRLAAAMPGGLSLRMDRGTRLRVDGAEQLSLIHGSLYVDTGGTAGSRRLRVMSPAGAIEHVGTQYRVTVQDGATRIAVREGALRLERRGGAQGEALVITRGRQLELTSGGAPAWSEVASYDASWRWAAEAAPAFGIDGRSVRAFLDWICREQGWHWSAGAGLEPAQLDAILLRGSIEGLAPRDALALVAAIAELAIVLDTEAGAITVEGATARGAQP
jgi:ferric-dicitrate binding protein FerR (iron transport regulator)